MSLRELSSNKADLKHPKYRPDIDGLRAIAVLAVVGFHAFPSWVKGGFVGVDIFFVISGYLISTIIFENLENDSFSFLQFYARRIRRIFPALLLVLFTCYSAGWFILLADEFQILGKHIAGGASFISNFLLWHESGYFDTAAATKPLLHLWSLAIEEQFYIVWPFFLMLIWKRRLNTLFLITLIIVISFTWNAATVVADAAAAFYSPQTRFWELLLGAVLAYYKLHPEKFPVLAKRPANKSSTSECAKSLHGSVVSCIGMMLLVGGILFISRDKAFPGWWALLPTVGTVLIILAGPSALVNRLLLSNRLLVGIGLISFPLYLWHWPLLSFTRIVQSQPTLRGIRIGIVLLSFLLAFLTYRFVERPIRFGRYKTAKTFMLLLLLILFGCVGTVTYLQNGLGFRKVVQINPDKHSGWAGGALKHLVNDCGVSNPEEKKLFARCDQDERGAPRYALLGDSKAASLYKGLMRTSFDGGRWLMIGGYKYGAPVPIISDSPLYANFQDITKIAVDALCRNEDIETVAFMTATRIVFRLKDGRYMEDLPESKNYEAALDGLSNAAAKFIKAGKKVVLIVDNPTLPDPADCLDRKTSLSFLNDLLLQEPNPRCRLLLSHHLELTRKYRDLLLDVQSTNPEKIMIFDTTPYLCDEEQGLCLAHKNGRRLYEYSDHISDYAAGLIGEGLNAVLREKNKE